ncbi:uncharacterized protein VK521_013837 [Ammospiza maritima maritima]
MAAATCHQKPELDASWIQSAACAVSSSFESPKRLQQSESRNLGLLSFAPLRKGCVLKFRIAQDASRTQAAITSKSGRFEGPKWFQQSAIRNLSWRSAASRDSRWCQLHYFFQPIASVTRVIFPVSKKMFEIEASGDLRIVAVRNRRGVAMQKDKNWAEPSSRVTGLPQAGSPGREQQSRPVGKVLHLRSILAEHAHGRWVQAQGVFLPLLEGPGRGGCVGGRKGALLALAALVRGCGSALRQQYLGVVLGALWARLGDPEGAVRGAAAAAVRELQEELQPELSPVAARALPAVLGPFWGSPSSPNSDPNPGEGVQPWLPQVLPRILAALEAPEEPRARELALSALHALGSGCPWPRPCGGGAAGGAGARAAIGQWQRPRGHQGHSGAARGRLGAVGGGDGAAAAAAAPGAAGGAAPATPPSDAPDWLLGLHDDLEGAEPMEDDASTEWAEAEEAEVGRAFAGLAEAALGALGDLAENCGSTFLPYLEPSLDAILDLTQFPQSQVRGAAYEALGSLCCCGRDAQTGPSPSQHEAFRALLGGVRKDPEVGGALAAVGGVSQILQPPGHAHKEWLEPIGRALCDVITGEVACLRSRADDDEEETSQRSELRETASD